MLSLASVPINMARGSGTGDFIAGIFMAGMIVLVVSEIFKIGFWSSAGIVLAVYAGVFLAALVANKIKQRRPCAHGVRRGKDGGCRACIAEEARRQAEWRAHQAILESKREIEEKASALRASELKTLRKRWLSRSEHYLQMGPQQFENAVAELFRDLGYEVKQTPYSNDRGKDAIAWKDGKKYLIECKRYEASNTIGRRDLQIFVAAMKEENAQGGFYVNTGKFANTAPEYAAQNQIELYDRAKLPALVNRVYPIREDVSTATVMCRECSAVQELPVAETPTSGTCVNGHQMTNDITSALIRSASFAPDTVCDRCGSEMRLVNGWRGKFWGCSRYPQCRFTRRHRAVAADR